MSTVHVIDYATTDGLTDLGRSVESEVDTVQRQSFLEECQHKRELAESVGLEGVTKTLNHTMTVMQLKEAIEYPWLSPDELMTWKAYLPTSYVLSFKKQAHFSWRSRPRAWGDYVFDVPPLDVLSIIVKERETKRFDALAICTPERQAPDPILVGFLNNCYFLLARWGESLKSFKEIQDEVKKSPASGLTRGTLMSNNTEAILKERHEANMRQLNGFSLPSIQAQHTHIRY